MIKYKIDGIIIQQFVWNVVDSNSYLLIEKSHGLLIDAIDDQELYREIERLDSLTIILTHAHFDHIVGLNTIRIIKPDAKVVSTRLCSECLGNTNKNMSSVATAFLAFYSGNNEISFDPFKCDPSEITFDRKYEFNWCGHRVKVSAFHGHSADSLVVIVDKKIMFSGDTILPIPTVTRFPTGSTQRFREEDLPELILLNQSILTFPGHGSPGQLGDMIAVNKEKYRME